MLVGGQGLMLVGGQGLRLGGQGPTAGLHHPEAPVDEARGMHDGAGEVGHAVTAANGGGGGG